MKITRRQLRKMISESVGADANINKDREAFYVLAFVQHFTSALLNERLKGPITRIMQTEILGPDIIDSPSRVFDYVELLFLLKAVYQGLNNSKHAFFRSENYDRNNFREYQNIASEAEFLGGDPNVDPYTQILRLEDFVLRGTPVGMSLVDALRNFGGDVYRYSYSAPEQIDRIVNLLDDPETQRLLDKV